MIDDRTAHELAAKLHNANGRIARATRPSQITRVLLDSLGDARTIISDVIMVLCERAEPMPVIPPAHPPIDPNLIDLAKGPF